MEHQREINFITTPSKTRLNEGMVCYQGQLQHNQVLGADETRKLFAQYAGEPKPNTNRYIDLLGSFMRERIAEGYHVDFGPFSMGLKLRGGFPSANAPFDEKANAISVVLKPHSDIKKAVAALKPINVTCVPSRITCIMQENPPSATCDTIDATGTRQLYVATHKLWVHAGVADEGVWIEDDHGLSLLTGTVTESSCTRTFATFTDPIAPGGYWLVARGRLGDSELLSARRRITAV